MKNIARLLVVVIVLLIAGVLIAYNWYQSGIVQPNDSSDELVSFTVQSGESVDTIAGNLVKANLLRDQTLFVLYGKLNPEKIVAIQAGLFDIKKSSAITDLYETLKKAHNKDDIRITVQEGIRYDQVVEIVATGLKDSPNFKKSELVSIIEKPDKYKFSASVQKFLDEYKPAGTNLEGYLFPDTYFFPKNVSAQDVVEKMVQNLSVRLSDNDYAALKQSKYSLHDILIIASLLERETSTKEQGPLVAGVIYNRLEKGVNGVKLLQIDSSLAYITKDWNADIVSLKSSASKYNTFKYPGLTPTPICNPGISTIRAALFPQKSNYYYYLNDVKGVIYYAETYSEFLVLVRKYI